MRGCFKHYLPMVLESLTNLWEILHQMGNVLSFGGKNMFLGKDPCDISIEWKEWHLQAYVVMMARRDGYTVHGDQNGASKTHKGWSQAAATGMLKGWPDLCLILAHGPLWIELKIGNGKLSKEQIDLHGVMRSAGCRVETVAANSPGECWEKVKCIIAPL